MVAAVGGLRVMLLSSCATEPHPGDSGDGSQSMDKKAQSSLFAQRAMQERRLKPPDQIIACPRCQSLNTKFCYYNNYSLTQPRHFCKNCRRYWTAGGTLRNVPVGGGCRKNKRAKQRSTDLSTVLTSVESSVGALRSDGAGSALHATFNPGSASSSAGYYDQHYEIDATKVALARAQQSIRAGPSGVSQSTEGSGITQNGHVSAFSIAHGSQGSGLSHSSAYEPSGMMSLGYFNAVKQDPGLSNGDLSAIFESTQSYRAAAAAAAAAAAGSMPENLCTYNIDIDALNAIDAADVQWRLQAAAQKQVGMWEEEQEHRDGRQVMQHVEEKGLMESLRQHVEEKGLMESLRQAKGKSAMLSPTSRISDVEAEVSRPVPMWQAVPETLQSFETVSHDSTFWSNNGWPPLDLHALNGAAGTQLL